MKAILTLEETKTPKKISYISGSGSFVYFKKPNFLIFWKSYIQNLSILRTKRIFRNLVSLEPEIYSEHCQTSTMERFAKTAT